MRLAAARLRHARARPPTRGRGISAFDSFCGGPSKAGFPGSTTVTTSGECWSQSPPARPRLGPAQRRLKRGGGRVRTEADLALAALEAGGIAQAPAGEPSPELAAILADECRRLFDALPEPSLREAARMRLEGYTDREIAAVQNCGLSTVERRLRTIGAAGRPGRG